MSHLTGTSECFCPQQPPQLTHHYVKMLHCHGEHPGLLHRGSDVGTSPPDGLSPPSLDSQGPVDGETNTNGACISSWRRCVCNDKPDFNQDKSAKVLDSVLPVMGQLSQAYHISSWAVSLGSYVAIVPRPLAEHITWHHWKTSWVKLMTQAQAPFGTHPNSRLHTVLTCQCVIETKF